MQTKAKRLLSMLLSLVLIVLSLSGISAYFTDMDKVTNVFTIGGVSIKLEEPNWENEYPILPNETAKKDPQVTNDGGSDAFIYVTVEVPYAKVETSDTDGTNKTGPVDTELFHYEVNNGWVEIGTPVKDETKGTITHVYAYTTNGTTLTPLTDGQTTPPVFDEITFANVVETPGDDGTLKDLVSKDTLDVVVNAYAVQTDLPGVDDDVEDVWDFIQNETEPKKEIPVTAFDKNGNDLHAEAEEITGQLKEDLLDSLEQSGLADPEDVDLMIDIKSDDFEDMADTTIDVSDVAKEGDEVYIFHYDEEKDEWEFVTNDTVDADGTVGGDFSSFSPVVIIVKPKDDGTDEELVVFAIYSEGSEATGDETLSFFRRKIDGVPTLDPNANLGDVYTTAVDTTQDDGEGTYSGTYSRTADAVYTGFEDMMYEGTLMPEWTQASGSGSGGSGGSGSDWDDILGGLGGLGGSGGLGDLGDLGNIGGIIGGLGGSPISQVEKIIFYDEIKPISTYHWFAEAIQCKSIDMKKLNTSRDTNMEAMFLDCQLVPDFDVSHFDTSNVTTMKEMFSYCASATYLDLSSFNTSKVTTFNSMFAQCAALEGANVTSFDTSIATDMNTMFGGCMQLKTIDLSSFNTSKVTDMTTMFYWDERLTTIYASELWSTESVTVSTEMFLDCKRLVGDGATYNGANIYDAVGASLDAYFTYKAAPTI